MFLQPENQHSLNQFVKSTVSRKGEMINIDVVELERLDNSTTMENDNNAAEIMHEDIHENLSSSSSSSHSEVLKWNQNVTLYNELNKLCNWQIICHKKMCDKYKHENSRYSFVMQILPIITATFQVSNPPKEIAGFTSSEVWQVVVYLLVLLLSVASTIISKIYNFKQELLTSHASSVAEFTELLSELATNIKPFIKSGQHAPSSLETHETNNNGTRNNDDFFAMTAQAKAKYLNIMTKSSECDESVVNEVYQLAKTFENSELHLSQSLVHSLPHTPLMPTKSLKKSTKTYNDVNNSSFSFKTQHSKQKMSRKLPHKDKRKSNEFQLHTIEEDKW